jgi:D-alanine transaminase/branched-chain amino acid aminotransferase
MRDMPEIKTTNYITAVNLQQFKKSEGAVEVLYIYDDEVLECATSNIFIIKDNTLITPAENVLKGITRKVLLELASDTYKVEEGIIYESDLKTADEIFICSSFKDIVPIINIDGTVVGGGKVGSVTKDIMFRYKALIGQNKS